MPDPSRASWEEIGSQLQGGLTGSVWRTYCDALNRQWISQQLAGSRFAAALKTDAFDEAVGEGVCPLLRGIAESVWVMDVSVATCRLATSRCTGLSAVACDIRKLPFRTGSLDLVVSLSTLDHFTLPAEIGTAVRCLWRVIRPGGRLLVTLDNPSNPLVRLRNLLPWKLLNKIGLVPYPVGATLHQKQLCRMLTGAGFTILDSTTLMHVPRFLTVAIASLLDRACGANMNRLSCRALHAFERLSRLPSSKWTGNYVAVTCLKAGAARTVALP